MDNQLRYSSHTRLEDFGEQSQNTLLRSSVLIIGAGGLGSIASIYLTTSGIGQITVVDFDTIDESNLPRQILFKADDLWNTIQKSSSIPLIKNFQKMK